MLETGGVTIEDGASVEEAASEKRSARLGLRLLQALTRRLKFADVYLGLASANAAPELESPAMKVPTHEPKSATSLHPDTDTLESYMASRGSSMSPQRLPLELDLVQIGVTKPMRVAMVLRPDKMYCASLAGLVIVGRQPSTADMRWTAFAKAAVQGSVQMLSTKAGVKVRGSKGLTIQDC